MPKLEVRNVVMEFPSVRALDGVSIGFEAGEVHGIVGENGAGKSTLMKILCGVQAPTSGELLLDGNQVHIGGVRQAQALGIGMIHQELNLVDELTVAENIFLGREMTKGGLLDRTRMIEAANKALGQVQASFPATAHVEDLSIAGKQLVEIAKAVSVNASILIMDEPTAVLSEPESEALFALIARLKEQGVTILYISHRLVEVCAICDQITVLRDGAWITTVDANTTTPAQLADLMVGRPLQDFYPTKLPSSPGEPILEVRGVGLGLSVSPGEILGVAGLVGAGRTELAEAIIGVRGFSDLLATKDLMESQSDTVSAKTPTPPSPASAALREREPEGRSGGRASDKLVGASSSHPPFIPPSRLGQPRRDPRHLGTEIPNKGGNGVFLDGEPSRIHSPKEAMRLGIAYVSEDRKKLGLLVSLSVVKNITLANLRAYGRFVIKAKAERNAAERWKKDLDIRVGDLNEPAMLLSGGNQQKVSVAKWLETNPRVLILDEPTRGVDVGAKREMYDLIQSLAAGGTACIVISSDLPEIIGLCHRAVVMREGRIVGELSGDELTEEGVMRLAAGVEAA